MGVEDNLRYEDYRRDFEQEAGVPPSDLAYKGNLLTWVRKNARYYAQGGWQWAQEEAQDLRKKVMWVSGERLHVPEVEEAFSGRVLAYMGSKFGESPRLSEERVELCRSYVLALIAGDMDEEQKEVAVQGAMEWALGSFTDVQAYLQSDLLVRDPQMAKRCIEARLPGRGGSNGGLGALVSRYAWNYARRRVATRIGLGPLVSGVYLARDSVHVAKALTNLYSWSWLPQQERRCWRRAGRNLTELYSELEFFVDAVGQQIDVATLPPWNERKWRRDLLTRARISRLSIRETSYKEKGVLGEVLTEIVNTLEPHTWDEPQGDLPEDAQAVLTLLEPVLAEVSEVYACYHAVLERAPSRAKMMAQTLLNLGSVATRTKNMTG